MASKVPSAFRAVCADAGQAPDHAERKGHVMMALTESDGGHLPYHACARDIYVKVVCPTLPPSSSKPLKSLKHQFPPGYCGCGFLVSLTC